MSVISASKEGVRISILVQPRASRTKLVGEHGEALKIALAAPPVDGEANEALIDFFSDLFDLRKNQVEIVSGHTGRRKTIALHGIDLATAHELTGISAK